MKTTELYFLLAAEKKDRFIVSLQIYFKFLINILIMFNKKSIVRVEH